MSATQPDQTDEEKKKAAAKLASRTGLQSPAVMIQRIGMSAAISAVKIHRTTLAFQGLLAGASAALQLQKDLEQLGVGLWIPPDAEPPAPGEPAPSYVWYMRMDGVPVEVPAPAGIGSSTGWSGSGGSDAGGGDGGSGSPGGGF